MIVWFGLFGLFLCGAGREGGGVKREEKKKKCNECVRKKKIKKLSTSFLSLFLTSLFPSLYSSLFLFLLFLRVSEQ